MTWKEELFRAFFVAFGATEVFTNLKYILSADGIAMARKQHQELPPSTSDKGMRIKTFLMFSWGIVFLLAGLLSYFLHQPLNSIFFISLLVFAVYACIEAFVYKFSHTVGFAIISLVLFFIYFLV